MAALQTQPPPGLPPRPAPRAATAFPGPPVGRPPLRSCLWCVVRWCPLAGAVVWAARAARLLGLAPLRLRRRNGTLRATPSPAWARLGYAYATCISIWLILMFAFDGIRMTRFTGLLFFTKITIHAIAETVAVLEAPGRMLAIVYCLDRADKITLQLRDRRMTFLQKASSSMCYLGIVALISVLERVTSMFDRPRYGLWDAYRIQVVVSKVFIWMFVVTASQAQAALTAARRELEHLLTDMEAPSSAVSASAQWQRVRRAARALGEASALARRLADAHRVPLIMHLIVQWFDLFFNSNLLVFSAKQQLNAEKIFCCELIMSTFFTLLVLVEPGHIMNNEMRRCGELGVRAWQMAATGAGPAAQLQLLATQLSAAPLAAPVHMPLAVLPFDRTLLFKIFGSVVTYLVIASPTFRIQNITT